MKNVAGLIAGVIVAACFSAETLAQSSAAPVVERVYTPLNLDKCKHIKGREVEDYGSWRCTGYSGTLVLVSAGDQRTYVSFGPNAAKEIAASETLASFNSEGKTIEWRIERGANGKRRAFAAILRWNTTVTGSDDKQVRGQVLVVTRLGPGGVCHVGYVDGRTNANANELAVKLADERARTFQCGKDKPVIVGEKGPGFSGPYNN
ncbi:MAG: hypothetical protein AB1490_22315 [Pseudomonadota bacterium]